MQCHTTPWALGAPPAAVPGCCIVCEAVPVVGKSCESLNTVGHVIFGSAGCSATRRDAVLHDGMQSHTTTWAVGAPPAAVLDYFTVYEVVRVVREVCEVVSVARQVIR